MQVDPRTRLHGARDARQRTDYQFDFWTAFGWTLLTCGFFGLFVDYKLVERMRDHNRRRLDFLTAVNELAWERAVAAGRQDELRERFQRVAAHLGVLQHQTTEFREPGIWLVLFIVGQGVAQIVAHVLIDMDLNTHSQAESFAEHELEQLLLTLGVPLAAPPPVPVKPRHEYVGRVVALLLSCGFYALWWWADLMREGNDHFRHNAEWEDAVLVAIA